MLGLSQKKDELIIELFRFENIIYGRILKQGEKVDKIFSAGGNFICKNRLEIYRGSHPELQVNKLYLQGTSKDRDNMWFCSSYPSISAANDVLDKIKAGIKEFNEYLKNDFIDKIGDGPILDTKNVLKALSVEDYN